MSPTSNQIAGFGLCVSSLIIRETLHILFLSGIWLETKIHVVCMNLHLQSSARWGRNGITAGSEETRYLGQACKCFSRNPAQVNDLNEVANQLINWSLRPKGEGRSGPNGLCYREKNFLGLILKCYSLVLFHWSGKYLLCLKSVPY